MKIRLSHKFEEIISIENLLAAWREFLRGKRYKKDVMIFSLNLMDNIISLHNDLLNHTYQHGGYQAFKVCDPKPRDIHKASVRDRLLHHAVYRILYPFFNRTFIADSYSCRLNKGTHRAVNRFRQFFYQASKNNTRPCWALKGDIRKFFANIDHQILINILIEYIPDQNIIWLLQNIIKSFSTKDKRDVGLPLGNLTSQLFVNIYMNKFDQFIKHKLKAKYYIRYCDDFVIFFEDKKWLAGQIEKIQYFLREELKLELHPDKIFIKTICSGVDFLGWVNFIDHRILRTKTKRRAISKLETQRQKLKNGLISVESFNQSRQSYLGILKHGQNYKLAEKIASIFNW